MHRTPLGMTPVFGLLMLSHSTAAGQPNEPSTPPDPHMDASDDGQAELVPPTLKRQPVIDYPETEGEPKQVAVLLAITVDETGRVVDPSIVEGAGEPFDSRALRMIHEFEFEPARRGDEPVAARVQYRLVFVPPPPPREPGTAPPPAPTAPTEQAPSAETTTPPPPPAESAATSREASADDEMFEAVAEVEAPPRETTRRALEEKELTRIPGTRGDALRAVEVLPGIGRTGFADNDGPPIIRGALPYESMVTLDGAPVPLLYHFGGLTSFYNSHLLEEVELYPGNFSSRYGRISGGVVEAKTRDPRSDRFHGMLELSLIDDFVLLETPVNDSTQIALGARRSNIDFVFANLVPEDAYSVVAAPVYYDYQAMLVHRFGEEHKLKLQAYGSYDRLQLFFSNPNDEDPTLKGSVDGMLQFHKLQANLESHLSPQVDQNLELAAGPLSASATIGDLHQEFTGLDLHGRAEWSLFASDSLRLDVGADTFVQTIHGKYFGPPPPQEEGSPAADQPLGTYENVSIDDTLYIVRPGGYVEVSYRPVSEWLLIPGVRADYDHGTKSWVVDPRFATRYSLGEMTTLKGGVGVYSQPPEYYQLISLFGNPHLEPYHALHTSLGIEQKLGEGFEVGLEGFYKYLYNRIVGTPGGAPPFFTNDGEGRIYGAEVSAELNHGSHFGYLAYTLSRSERRDRAEAWRLFDYDQTHVLSLVYNYDFGSGWSAGARFRLVTGNPETPVLGGVYDANSDLYRAVYGPINSERASAFHQLDVRGEKEWKFQDWSLTAYLELLNAYNAQNVEGTSYSFDYTKREDATGLPIFPNLGIRGEL